MDLLIALTVGALFGGAFGFVTGYVLAADREKGGQYYDYHR